MKKKKGLELRTVAGEQVLVATGAENIDFGHIIALNPSAAYLWKEITDKEFTVETLSDLLTAKYEVSPVQALNDSQTLIESWIRAGVVNE